MYNSIYLFRFKYKSLQHWEDFTRKYRLILLALLLIVIFQCEKSSTKSDDNDQIIEGVNLTKLFAPPSSDELTKIKSQWTSKTPEIKEIKIEDTTQAIINFKFHKTHVISHTNTENVKHYAALIFPTDTTKKHPVLFINHGGEEGIDFLSYVFLLNLNAQLINLAKNYILVFPSFRSEKLIMNPSTTYQSTGSHSPWDKDVDDCIGLLTTILRFYPLNADLSKVYALGISRGAGVSMLWAVRDNRVKKVVEFFGPTDFLSDWVKEKTISAILGESEDLSGFDYLNNTVLQPLKNNEISINEARHELIKRSSLYFLKNIIPLQIHHGQSDETIPVSQAEILITEASKLNLGTPDFQSFLYEETGHDISILIDGINDVTNFLLEQ